MHATHSKTPHNNCAHFDVVALHAPNTANSIMSVGFVCEVTHSYIFTILLSQLPIIPYIKQIKAMEQLLCKMKCFLPHSAKAVTILILYKNFPQP